MNTQKIKLLLTALEEGSLTKAGNLLGYTQSGVSQIIRSLEEELGVTLLVKGPSGVTATREAELLLPTMRQIVWNEEKLYEETAELLGLHRGTLRVGSFISTSVHWLPKVLMHFQQNYPEVEIRIEECGQKDMVRGLTEGTLDVALMSSAQSGNLDFIPILEDPIVVVFSEHYDLSGYDAVPVDVLRDLPVILTDPDYDRDARRIFERASFEPDIRYTSKDDYAVLAMVKHGLGVAVLPELVVEGYPEVVSHRLFRPEMYRTLGIGVRSVRESSPLVKHFIQYIQDNIR